MNAWRSVTQPMATYIDATEFDAVKQRNRLHKQNLVYLKRI